MLIRLLGVRCQSVELDRMNVTTGQANATCDQAATMDLPRRNATVATTILRTLTDEHLARSGCYLVGEPAERVDAWIEHVLIAHPGMHLPAIQKAVGGEVRRPLSTSATMDTTPLRESALAQKRLSF